MNERIQILGITIDPLTMKETVDAVEQYVLKKHPLHLMGVNADKINQCHEDEKIKKIVNESGIINADGASVVLTSKFLGAPVPERVAGIDLMQNLLELSKLLNKDILILMLLVIEMDIFYLKMKKRFRKILKIKNQTLCL